MISYGNGKNSINNSARLEDITENATKVISKLISPFWGVPIKRLTENIERSNMSAVQNKFK